MEIDVPLVIARWLHFAGEAVVFGASLFPIYALASPRDAAGLPWLRKTQCIVGWSSCIALIAGIGWLCATLVEMAGDVGGLFDPGILGGFFLETSFGPVWIARLVLLALMAIVAAPAALGRARAAPPPLLALLAGLSLASQAWLGHAAMATGARLAAELLSYMVHVLAVGAWIGGLLPLGLALAARLGAPPASQSTLEAECRMLWRFSDLGLWFVLAILASGIANSIFRLAAPSDLVDTDYGRLIVVKILLFAAALAVAAVNRWWLLPRTETFKREAVAKIARNILVEAGLAALVLAAAAILGTLSPQG